MVSAFPFPDIVKDCPKMRNLAKIFLRSFENAALDSMTPYFITIWNRTATSDSIIPGHRKSSKYFLVHWPARNRNTRKFTGNISNSNRNCEWIETKPNLLSAIHLQSDCIPAELLWRVNASRFLRGWVACKRRRSLPPWTWPL